MWSPPDRPLPAPDPRAVGLRDAIGARGIQVEIEPRGSLALICAPGGDTAAALVLANRLALAQLARDHGFTHVAFELLPSDPVGLPSPSVPATSEDLPGARSPG